MRTDSQYERSGVSNARRRMPLTRQPRPTLPWASYAQRRLWLLDQARDGSPEYNIPEALRLRGVLDRPALEAAVDAIVARHESLRTRFAAVGGEPVQMIEPVVRIAVPFHDLSALEPDEQQAALHAAIRREWDEPFDLSRGPMLRLRLLRLGEVEHVLLRTAHHIVCDAWSQGVFNRELMALYEACRTERPHDLPALSVQYADFALCQRQWLDTAALEPGLAYWREQLADLPEQPALRTDRPRPTEPTSAAGACHGSVPDTTVAALRQLGRDERATLYMTLLAAFGVLLARHGGQHDVVVASVIADRQHARLENLIGCLVNTLMLRLRVGLATPFRDLLRSVRRTTLDAYQHQDVPFDRLAEVLPQRQDPTPLVQVTFALQNAPEGALELPDLTVEPIRLEESRVRFDLEVHVWACDGRLAVSWIYNRDLFDRARIERMMRHYGTLLDAVVAQPDTPVGVLPMMDARERAALLTAGHGPTPVLPAATIPERFEQRVASHPDAAALIEGSSTVSYAALNASANQLAHTLLAAGVGPERIVAVALPSSIDLIVAQLGVVKAGGAYLPLDMSSPPERWRVLFEGTPPAVVLTTHTLLARLPDAVPCLVVDDPTLRQRLEAARAENPSDVDRGGRLTGAHAANVMYTSGSSGTPKGVVVPHVAVLRLVHEAGYATLGPSEVLLQASSTAFDASTYEVWGSLLTGALLVLSPHDQFDEDQLAAVLRTHGVTTLFLTSGLFHLMVSCRLPDLVGVRQLLAGGDTLPIADVRRVRAELPACRMVNIYGPTEVTTFSCHQVVDEIERAATTVPIGRPIGHTRAYVLDSRLELVPVGVAGELYLAGPGLARGYTSAALTASRFVADPYGPIGTRLYRTGDVVRWRDDHALEFMGRTDDQVKIRGFRVEPAEVERALRLCPAVLDAAVAVHTDRFGAKCLDGYVVPEPGRTLDAFEVRRDLEQHLPSYLIPATVTVLDRLPLTWQGKVDRRALPAPPAPAHETYLAPRTADEEILCTLWADVLSLPRVGIDDDFFVLGGHSLLATRVISRIRTALGIELSIRTLFEAPTVAELTRHLGEGTAALPPVEPQLRPTPLPVSSAQRRLWFLDQLGGGSPEYNLPEALRLRGVLDRAALEAAVNAIVSRHESLRTRFASVEGEPVQVIEPTVRIALPVEDLRGLDVSAQDAAVRAAIRSEWSEPFDLVGGPVIRARLLQLGETEHVLLRTLHHIVSDGWSQGVFNRELMVLYDACRMGRADPLPRPPVQYADFALWQRACLAGPTLDDGLAYWTRQLANCPERLTLPTDRPRPPAKTFTADAYRTTLSSAQNATLKRFGQTRDATVYVTLLAAFAVLLSRYSGQDDIVVGAPIANRRDAQLEGLIGFFVNLLAVRIQIAANASFRELLAAVRHTTLEAYRYQDVPFEKVVEATAPRRGLDASPIVQVAFVLQNAPIVLQELGGLHVEPWRHDEFRIRFDLEVYVIEYAGALEICWVYDRDLFDRWRIEQMAQHYFTVLDRVIADDNEPLTRLDLLSGGELLTVLDQFNAPRR